jgi:hypothetical protein
MSLNAQRLWASVAVALALLTLALYLTSAPTPLDFDEAFSSEWGRFVYATGNPNERGLLYFARHDGHLLLGVAGLGQWGAVFGVGLAQARAWVFALGVGACVAGVLALRRLGVRLPVAFMAACVAFMLLHQEAFARYDAFGVLLMGLAVWAWAWAQAKPARAYALVGFALAFALEGHQLYVRFALAFGLWQVGLAVWAWRARDRREGLRLAWLIAGGVIGALVYVVLRLLVFQYSPADFLAFVNRAYSTEATIGGLGLSLTERVAYGAGAWAQTLTLDNPLEGALVLAMSLYAFRKDGAPLRVWLFAYAVANALLFALNPKPTFTKFYTVHHLPLLMMAGGLWLNALARRYGARLPLALVALACVWGGVLLREKADNAPLRELVRAGELIHAFLPAEAQGIIASEPYYWALWSRGQVAPQNFGAVKVREGYSAQNLPLPDVVIQTVGWYDFPPNVEAFVREEGFTQVACVDVAGFGGVVWVYAHPRLQLPSSGACLGH